MIGAYKSEYGIIMKNDEADWLTYEDCIKLCAMSALKKEMGYNIILYPQKFVEFIKYWDKKFESI